MICVNACSVMRYVIPFSWKGEYTNQYKALQTDARWQTAPIPKAEVSLLPHIFATTHSTPEKNGIGSAWQYDFKNKLPRLTYREAEDAEPIPLRITEMGMYLFQTNVGLLWYELDISRCRQDLTSSRLILLQNRFKECSYTKKYFSMEQPRTQKEDPVYLPLDLAPWLSQFLAPLGDIYFLNGACIKDSVTCPGKALIFQYALFREGNEEALTRAAYHLANGYTEKYLPPADMPQNAYHPFRDVCIYASHSGCGFYALENQGNGAFYTGNHADNVRREYFLMYALSLYQTFSLMNYARISGEEFPSDPEAYNRHGEMGQKLDRFLAELNTFLMKGFHTTVSNMQHHNEFYNYLKTRLMIREDIDSIRIGTEALVELQHIRNERWEEQQREAESDEQTRRDRSLNISLAALSMLSLASAFLDLYGLSDTVGKANWLELWILLCAGDWRIIATIVAYLIAAGISIFCIITCIRTYYSQHKSDKSKKIK